MHVCNEVLRVMVITISWFKLFIFLCAHSTYVCYDRLLLLFFYSFNISVCMEYTGTGLENMLREFTDGQPLPACFYVP